MKEYILCAAIHFDNGKTYVHQPKNITSGYVVCGRRHHNCFTTIAAIRSLSGTEDKDIDGFAPEKEQGFITNLDRFVDRKEAVKIALLSGQIKEEKRVLFSEDLY